MSRSFLTSSGWALFASLVCEPVRAIDGGEIATTARRVLDAGANGRIDVRHASWDGRVVGIDFTSGALDATARLSAAGECAFDEVCHEISNLLLAEGTADAEFFLRIDGRPLEDFLEPRPPAMARSPLPAPGPKVALGPGHGYYNHHSLGWTLQRSYFFGIVEDFMNVEFILAADAALRPMGFDIVPLRNFSKGAGNGESGRPKWQECARQHLKTIGAPSSVWDSAVSSDPDVQYNQDIRARPLYANYAGAGLLVSLHNNAGGGTGTETLYDTTNSQQDGSRRFADIVNAKIVSRIRSQYNASWVNRGVKGFNGNYGENRLAQCPSVIIEVAFFDRQSPDNDAQHDPVFHQLVGKAIADSVAEFFSQPVLTYSAHQIDDDAINESVGNGDGEIDAGETIELKITLRNAGPGAATGVIGTLTVNDPFVRVSDPDTTWPNIATGASVISAGDFGLTVSPACPPSHVFSASFTFEADQGIWTHMLPLVVVHSVPADLVDAGPAFHNISTVEAVPGQNVTITGKVNNAGPAPAGPFKVRFFASVDATITSADIVIGQFSIASLAGNSSLPFNSILPLPASVPAGRYFIGWLADADGSVNESDETNNAVAITSKRLAVLTPGSEVSIVSLEIQPGGVEVQFTTKPGYTYALERGENLAQWTRVFSEIAGTGGLLTRTDPAGAASSRAFYRVIEE